MAIGLSFAHLAAFNRWKPMLGYSERDTHFMKAFAGPGRILSSHCQRFAAGRHSVITLFVFRVTGPGPRPVRPLRPVRRTEYRRAYQILAAADMRAFFAWNSSAHGRRYGKRHRRLKAAS